MICFVGTTAPSKSVAPRTVPERRLETTLPAFVPLEGFEELASRGYQLSLIPSIQVSAMEGSPPWSLAATHEAVVSPACCAAFKEKAAVAAKAAYDSTAAATAQVKQKAASRDWTKESQALGRAQQSAFGFYHPYPPFPPPSARTRPALAPRHVQRVWAGMQVCRKPCLVPVVASHRQHQPGGHCES